MTQETIAEKLARVGESEWVREMRAYYRKNGHFRPKDLRRLLGDPTKGIEIGPRKSLARNLLMGT